MFSIRHNIDQMPRFIWKMFFYTAILWLFGLFEVIKTQNIMNPAFFFETIILILTLFRSKKSWMFLLLMTSLILISRTITISRAMYGSDFEKFAIPDDELQPAMSGYMMDEIENVSGQLLPTMVEMTVEQDETTKR